MSTVGTQPAVKIAVAFAPALVGLASTVLCVLNTLSVSTAAVAATAPLGPEFQVNVYTFGLQSRLSVASGGAGTFVVAWESSDRGFPFPSGQDGSETGIFARRFSSVGLPVGGEFQVNTYTTGWQSSSTAGT